MYGATRSAMSFITKVGIGSAADDLSGRRRITELTSSTVVFQKVDSDDDDVIGVKVGEDESSVARRTASILLETQWQCRHAYSLAEMQVLAARRPRPRRLSTDCLSATASLDPTLYANARNQMSFYAAIGGRFVAGGTRCHIPEQPPKSHDDNGWNSVAEEFV